MNGIVVRNIQRAEASVVESLGRFGVATIHEAQGRSGLMKTHMRPIYEGARTVGTAVTVLTHPGDNWMLHVAIEQIRPGDVVVAACSADNTDGMFGELLGTQFKTHGARGLIIDAGCRDVTDLKKLGFPVWSRAISAKGTVKSTVGSVNIPVVCAGALVNPGDVIIADDDGVVVVPRADAARVAAEAEAREAKEAIARGHYAAGELSLDLNNMREALERAGLRYVDDLPHGGA